MDKIIDTGPFQRLRRIVQTSYTPLFSSAVHNRFVHSLGVFHLGKIACEQLKKETYNKCDLFKQDDLNRIGEIFQLACLLHDVGHAPFSHTGEGLYLDNNEDYNKLHKLLIAYVSSKRFETNLPNAKSEMAAPHEIMSAIVGLKEFGDFFDNENAREFFARCITGYKYPENNNYEDSLKNCFISLLNSNVIDVDKLDYLIRDAFFTGFDTIKIDYKRLLTSITVMKSDTGISLAYYKGAISVIENVVYAHDAEKKWIQIHPTVIYEIYILQCIMKQLQKDMEYKNRRLISMETLGNNHVKFKKNIEINYLCDDDIVFLMKNIYPSELSKEYFNRNERHHPVWKSEIEYKALLSDASETLKKALTITAKHLYKNTDSWSINDQLINTLESDLKELDKETFDEYTINTNKSDKEIILKVAKCLKDFAKEKDIPFDFILVASSRFKSGFGKTDFSNTKIIFPYGDEVVETNGEKLSSLQAKNTRTDDFFYLFFKKDDSNEEFDKLQLCSKLKKLYKPY